MSNNNPLIGSLSGECSGVSFALPKNATVRLSDRERDQRDPNGQTNGNRTQGTLASNTVAPNDKNKHFKALLFGIDSLYLSYYGQLAEDWDKKFHSRESRNTEILVNLFNGRINNHNS